MAFNNNLALSITLGTKGGLQQALAEFAKLTQAEKDLAIQAQLTARQQIAQQKAVSDYLKTVSKERAQDYKDAFREIEIAERNYAALVTQLAKQEAAQKKQVEREVAQAVKASITQQSEDQRILEQVIKESEQRIALATKERVQQQLAADRQALNEAKQIANERRDLISNGLTVAGFAAAPVSAGADRILAGGLTERIVTEDTLAKLEALTGGADSAQKKLEELRATASKYGFDQDAQAAGYAGLAIRLQGTTVQGEALDTLYKNLSISGRALGISSGTLSGALQQLAQGLGTNALRGDELRSVTEAGIISQASLAKALGINVSQLKKYAEAGKITNDIVLKAAQITADQFEPAALKAADTLGAVSERFKNAQKSAEDALGKGLEPATKSLLSLGTQGLDFFSKLPEDIQGATGGLLLFADGLSKLVIPAATLNFFTGGALVDAGTKLLGVSGGVGVLATRLGALTIVGGLAAASILLWKKNLDDIKTDQNIGAITEDLKDLSGNLDNVTSALKKYVQQTKEGKDTTALGQAIREQIAAIKAQDEAILASASATKEQKNAAREQINALEISLGVLDKYIPKVKEQADALNDLTKAYAAASDKAKALYEQEQLALQESLTSQNSTQAEYEAGSFALKQKFSEQSVALLQKELEAAKVATLGKNQTEEDRAKFVASIEEKITATKLSNAQQAYQEQERLRKLDEENYAQKGLAQIANLNSQIGLANGANQLAKEKASVADRIAEREIKSLEAQGRIAEADDKRLQLQIRQSAELDRQYQSQLNILSLQNQIKQLEIEDQITKANQNINARIAAGAKKEEVDQLKQGVANLEKQKTIYAEIGKEAKANATATYQDKVKDNAIRDLQAAKDATQRNRIIEGLEKTLRNQGLSKEAIAAQVAEILRLADAQQPVESSSAKTRDNYSGAADQAGRLAENLGRAAEKSGEIKAPNLSSKNATSGKYEGRAGGLSNVDPNRPYASRDDARYNATNPTQAASDAAGNRYQEAVDRAFATGTALPTFGDISTYNEPKPPQAAEGALVKNKPGGTLVNVGEARHDEVILPLNERGASYMANVLQQYAPAQSPSVSLNQEPVIKELRGVSGLLERSLQRSPQIVIQAGESNGGSEYYDNRAFYSQFGR